MGVDRFRVCELYAAGPDVERSGSGYRLGDRLVLTARHVIVPALAGPSGQVLIRPVGTKEWLPALVEWHDGDADAALLVIKDQAWRAPARDSVLRWGELTGSDPVPCAAVGFPWASARPDQMRDTAHVYGQLAPLGQLRQGRLDLDVASASPSAREGGSPWAGMSGAGVIVDSHLVGVVIVDPVRYEGRLVAVPVSQLLADAGFQDRLSAHEVSAEVVPVGADWYLRLSGEQTVSLAPAYRPVSSRFRTAPSTLLRPEHGLVPFLGRRQLLDQICSWCQSLAGTPVLLIRGGGGSGKTRLGREACVRMLVAGWDAGLADDQRRRGAATDRLQRPTLLVIDDADLKATLISGLIDYLRWDEAGPPVGLLLLARAAGAWWERLVRQQELAGSYTVLDMDHHPLPPADRAEHFRQASTAFALFSGAGTQPAQVPVQTELEDPAYAEPLLIHIAALLRTVGQSTASPPTRTAEQHALEEDISARESIPVRRVLLQALCERERSRWYELGYMSHLPFNPDLPFTDQVVALATLTAAGDQPSAISLLTALPNQAEVTRIGAEALATWAHRLYTGPGYWNPLRPDLLAEQHLADTDQLPALATTAAQLAAGQDFEAALLTQLLAELTRGALNQPTVGAALHSLLTEALSRIVDLAVAADDAELADLASLALQLAPQPALAATLVSRMPDNSVRLAALSASLASQQVTHYRTALAGGDPNNADRLAEALRNLSNRLAGLGRREEALAAIEEATGLYRELAAARPDAFGGRLGSALNNLSNRLSELGRPEEALAAIEEATGLYRELAAARPDAFGGRLGMALTNLSSRLSALGRREEALAAIEEATSAYRDLAAARRDAFLPDLALSLNNLASKVADLGRWEESLAASQEAAGLFRELAAANADSFLPSLAVSLNNQSTFLAGLGRWEEALAAGEEATGLYRELAATRPDAFLPDLAWSLNNLSHWLGDLGRREEALAASQEAVGVYRELAAARPAVFRADLADSLNNLAVGLADLGQREEALAAIEEATGLSRELASVRPDAFRPNLAVSLNNLSLRFADLGRREEASAAIEEATGIYRELAAARPDAFRPDLARSLNNRSLRLGDLGRREEALAAIEEATGIYRELAAARPDAFRPDLARSLNNRSNRLGDLGRREEALAAIEEATDIYRELAVARPDVFRPDVARSLNNRSVQLARLGRREEALVTIEEATGLYRELAVARPEAFRPDLARSLYNRSLRLGDLGRREEALAAIEEATGLFRELVARWPDAYSRSLAQSLQVVASLENGQGTGATV
jgi:Tetratricopeptide repeat/Anaphase-promoting complex subunit 5